MKTRKQYKQEETVSASFTNDTLPCFDKEVMSLVIPKFRQSGRYPEITACPSVTAVVCVFYFDSPSLLTRRPVNDRLSKVKYCLWFVIKVRINSW